MPGRQYLSVPALMLARPGVSAQADKPLKGSVSSHLPYSNLLQHTQQNCSYMLRASELGLDGTQQLRLCFMQEMALVRKPAAKGQKADEHFEYVYLSAISAKNFGHLAHHPQLFCDALISTEKPAHIHTLACTRACTQHNVKCPRRYLCSSDFSPSATSNCSRIGINWSSSEANCKRHT